MRSERSGAIVLFAIPIVPFQGTGVRAPEPTAAPWAGESKPFGLPYGAVQIFGKEGGALECQVAECRAQIGSRNARPDSLPPGSTWRLAFAKGTLRTRHRKVERCQDVTAPLAVSRRGTAMNRGGPGRSPSLRSPPVLRQAATSIRERRRMRWGGELIR